MLSEGLRDSSASKQNESEPHPSDAQPTVLLLLSISAAVGLGGAKFLLCNMSEDDSRVQK